MTTKATTDLSSEEAVRVVDGLKALGWVFHEGEKGKLIVALISGGGTALGYDSSGTDHVFIVRAAHPGKHEGLQSLELFVCRHRDDVIIPTSFVKKFTLTEPEPISVDMRCSFMSDGIFMFRTSRNPEMTHMVIFDDPRLICLGDFLLPLEPAPDSAP